MGKYLVFAAVTVLMTMSAQGQSSARRIEILLATYGSADRSLIATETFEQACVDPTQPCTFFCKNESFRRDPAPGDPGKHCLVAWKCGEKSFFHSFVESDAKQELYCD